MTLHRLINCLIVVCLTCMFALALGVLGPSMEPGYPREVKERALRRDLQAAEFCRVNSGRSTFEWAESGELVCIPRAFIQSTR